MHFFTKHPIRIVLLAVLIGIISGCRQGSEVQLEQQGRIPAGQDFEIISATDMHYLAKSLNDDGEAFQKFIAGGDGKDLVYSEELMQALKYQIVSRKADIVLFSGDISNNGEKESHLDLAKRFKEIEDTGARVYVVPGNHDLLNPWARKFEQESQYKTDSISPEEFRSMYGDFGYNEAISLDKTTLSYLVAPSEDVWLLMLDTALYKQNEELGYPRLDGQLSDSTMKWILDCGKLAAKSGAKLVAVMHHNLLKHSQVVSEGFTLNNSSEAVDVLRKAGVEIVYSGHSHLQDIASEQEPGKTPIYDIDEGALSVYPHLYGVTQYSAATHNFHYSAFPLDVEQWAHESGATDPNLLNFDQYSTDSAAAIAKDKYYKRLSDTPALKKYTPEQLTEMAEFIGKFNTIVLAGADPGQLSGLLTSDGYKLWSEAPDGVPFKSYILQTAAQTGDKKNNLSLQVTMP